MNLADRIRDIPDFPKEGIVFKDITTLLQDPAAFKEAIDRFAKQYEGQGVDVVVGVEARGFIFGGALAVALGAGFVPVRKPGKLPSSTYRQSYELEYGTDSVEIHQDAIAEGQRVLLVDDLLATGGTIGAVVELLKNFKCEIVAIAFLIELDFLKGRARLADQKLFSIIHY